MLVILKKLEAYDQSTQLILQIMTLNYLKKLASEKLIFFLNIKFYWIYC